MRTHYSLDNSKLSKGSLLLELLVVISILAIILTVGAQAVYVSMQSSKVSGERDVASGLANEALEAVRAVSDERWQNIYNTTKGTQHYYATSTAPTGKWTLISGDETVVLNNTTYTRYMTIENVSRDDASRAIVDTDGSDDPSTQKVMVVVSWPNAEPLIINEYFFRWRNKICSQTAWSSGGSGTSVKICPDTSYDTKDAGVDTTGGTLKLQ